MNKTVLPFKINIAKPCPARWEDMGGGDQVRFCDHCRKNVYNLSAMTGVEATALLQKGNLCARIYQRADGTVLTEDCPVGIAQYWRRVKVFTASAVAVFLFALVNFAAFGRQANGTSTNAARGRLTTAIEDAKYKVKGWAGMNPPMMSMGMVCTVAPSKAPLPVMGRVAVTPKPSTTPGQKTNGGSWITGEIAPSTTQPGSKTNSPSAPAKK